MTAAPPFACPWTHPDCAHEAGPNHFRHVPVAEAAAMPDTPEHYLLNVWMADPSAYLALAARPDLTPVLRARVVHLARCGPQHARADGTEVAGEEWLLAALAIATLDATELAQVAGVTYSYCRTDPAAVTAAALAHRSAGAETAAALLGNLWMLPPKGAGQLEACLSAIDAAGWPASLARDVYRHPGRRRGLGIDEVCMRLAEDRDLAHVVARMTASFTGSLTELLDAAAAVTDA